MDTQEITATLTTLFRELVHGADKRGGYMLNGGDEGLLRSLDKLSASQASALTPTGSSIAAHVDHLRYGLSLMNRWGRGEDPFGTANWSESWTKTAVSEDEWEQRRGALQQEAAQWLQTIGQPRQVDETELGGMIGSIAHLAYHLDAIRQIDQSARGPADLPKPGVL